MLRIPQYHAILKGDSFIDYDDVIPQVLQDQRRVGDMGHIHN